MSSFCSAVTFDFAVTVVGHCNVEEQNGGRVKTGDSFHSLTADRLICVFDFDVGNLFLM